MAVPIRPDAQTLVASPVRGFSSQGGVLSSPRSIGHNEQSTLRLSPNFSPYGSVDVFNFDFGGEGGGAEFDDVSNVGALDDVFGSIWERPATADIPPAEESGKVKKRLVLLEKGAQVKEQVKESRPTGRFVIDQGTRDAESVRARPRFQREEQSQFRAYVIESVMPKRVVLKRKAYEMDLDLDMRGLDETLPFDVGRGAHASTPLEDAGHVGDMSIASESEDAHLADISALEDVRELFVGRRGQKKVQLQSARLQMYADHLEKEIDTLRVRTFQSLVSATWGRRETACAFVACLDLADQGYFKLEQMEPWGDIFVSVG